MKLNTEKCLRDTLSKKHACYVLITCDAPSDNGDMSVEMSYEGDATLAAYLLQGAQEFMDEQHCEESPRCGNKNKIHHL